MFFSVNKSHLDEANGPLLEGDVSTSWAIRRAQISSKQLTTHIFWSFVILLQLTTLWLVFHPSPPKLISSVAVANDINGIVPEFSTTNTLFNYETDTFVPGPNDTDITAAIWDNWTSLIPIGNGVITVDDHKKYPHLADPTVWPDEDEASANEAKYTMAWVHQLHCLYFVMKEYHRVLHHGPDGTEYYIDPTHNAYHASHCFNYLRQSILCYADSTLEGAGQGSGTPDGSGQTHVCKNRHESMQWLEERRYDDTHAIDNYVPEGAHADLD